MNEDILKLYDIFSHSEDIVGYNNVIASYMKSDEVLNVCDDSDKELIDTTLNNISKNIEILVSILSKCGSYYSHKEE